MQHTGYVFLSRTRPHAGPAKCGVFQVQLHVLDRIDQHRTESWRITYSGPAAQRFWHKHEAQLKPGTPLHVTLEQARTHTLYTRPPVAELHARAICVELAEHAHQPPQNANANTAHA